MREETAIPCYNREYPHMQTAQDVQPPRAASIHHERDWLSMATSHYTSSDIQRFWNKVDTSGGDDACWNWTASLNNHGYGQLRVGGRKGKPERAHRISYALAHGAIPDAMFVCHTCDNRRCVNPRHLFLGEAADNMRDMIEKGRASHPGVSGERHGSKTKPERVARGERHGTAKLTEAEVVSIRERYARGGITQRKLAIEHSVSQGTIGFILRGETWVGGMELRPRAAKWESR